MRSDTNYNILKVSVKTDAFFLKKLTVFSEYVDFWGIHYLRKKASISAETL